MKMNSNRQVHEFGPFFDEDSEILILGSFPSVKSREQKFYYGHPQNRFWKLMVILFGDQNAGADAARQKSSERELRSIDEKKAFLKEKHIALWDVIASCEITGSSDSSIKDPVINDLGLVIPNTKINRIFINGGLACRLFEKHMAAQAKSFGILPSYCFKMPSTSPANASYSLQRLEECWREGLRQ